MVSFQCEGCGDTVKKPKLPQHTNQCHAPVTCIDCMTTFYGRDFQKHTSCMTEDQKYQGHLYREKSKGPKQKSVSILEPTDTNAIASAKAYVENEVPPAVPTPPPAVPNHKSNRDSVFDYLVEDENQGTPKLTYTDKDMAGEMSMKNNAPGIFSSRPNSRADHRTAEEQLQADSYEQHGFSYGADPVQARPAGINGSTVSLEFTTPATKAAKAKSSLPPSASHSRQNSNTEKKRKRAQTDDTNMTDAPDTIVRSVVDQPNVVHSGLTGGLQRMVTDENFRYPKSPESSPEPQQRTTKLKPVREPKSRQTHQDDPQSPQKRTRRSSKQDEGLGISVKGRAGGFLGLVKETLIPGTSESVVGKSSRRRASSSDQNGSTTRDRDDERRETKKVKVPRRNGTSRDNVRMERGSREGSRKPRRHGGDNDRSRSPDDSRHKRAKAIEYHRGGFSSDSEDDRRKNGKAMVVFGAEEKQRRNAESFLSHVTRGPESVIGYSIDKVLKRWHHDNETRKPESKRDEEKKLWKGLRLKRNDRGEIVVFFKYEEQ